MQATVLVNGKSVHDHYRLCGISSDEYFEMTPEEQNIQAGLLGELDQLLNKAIAAGFTLEVTHESVRPLAMRNIRMVATVRKMRNNQRIVTRLIADTPVEPDVPVKVVQLPTMFAPSEYEGDEQVIPNHDQMTLSLPDQSVLAEAIIDPPEANNALVTAFANRAHLLESDSEPFLQTR